MTTTYYFSAWLNHLKTYQPVWTQIESALKSENESYALLSNTKDIWVRDFMPFQRHDGKPVIYRYAPDYLRGKDVKYITNCRGTLLDSGICDEHHLSECLHTDLIIDGGNMIRCTDKNGKDCVIMTTKVLYENPAATHHNIIEQLERILNAEVILIPWDIEEKYGHSDGMVRSLEPGKLLMNCYADIDPRFGAILKNALGNRFEIQELKFGKDCREKSWCHLNYLELTNAILVPTANIASDKVALSELEIITGKRSIPISMSSIISDGGAMHCISWNQTI